MKVFIIEVDVSDESDFSCEELVKYLREGMAEQGIMLPPTVSCQEYRMQVLSSYTEGPDPETEKRLMEFLKKRNEGE